MRTVRAGRIVDRNGDQLEVDRVLVVQDQEHVLPGDDSVLEGVLDAVAAGEHDPELALGIVGLEHPHLAGDLGRQTDHEVAVGLRAADADEVALVRLLEDEHVVAGRAERVAPHLVGAPGLVDGRVEEVGRARRPGRSAAGRRDLVGEHLAGAQVLDLDRVALVALGVDGPGQEVAVVADAERAEREELVAVGLDVGVEQHLLAVDRGLGVERRRVPVVGVADRAAAADRVLLALDGAGVVPPVAAAYGHREVGLERAGLDLVEDLLAQRFEVRRRLVGVGVLGLEVGQRRRVLLVAQPLVVVDEVVAVVAADDGSDLGSGDGAA